MGVAEQGGEMEKWVVREKQASAANTAGAIGTPLSVGTCCNAAQTARRRPHQLSLHHDVGGRRDTGVPRARALLLHATRSPAGTTAIATHAARRQPVAGALLLLLRITAARAVHA